MAIMDTRQHHSEPTRILPGGRRIPLFLSDVLQTIIELPFWLFLITIKVLGDSAVVRQCCNVCIDCLIHITQRIVQDPIIQETISTTISEGMNRFVQQPDLDQLLLHMVTSISKSQPDIARQQGQDFPIVVSSFVQGIIQHAVNRKTPQKVSHNTNTNKSGFHIQADDTTQQLRPHQLSFEQLRTEAVECSIENTNSINIDATDQIATDSITDESPAAVTVPIPPIDHDETLNDTMVVCTSSSTSSLLTVTAPIPTDRHVHSDEHEVVECSPTSQANESNNISLLIDKGSLDSTDITGTTSVAPKDDATVPLEESSDTTKNKHNGLWW